MNPSSQTLAWLAVGVAGQVAFSSRFLVQWVASERKGRSVVPTAFWWLSLVGGAILLVYALARRDPVFLLGQGAGVVVYARNLMLVRRESRERADQWVPDRRSFGA
jgi:lipid-A-disaccharide synthase-like uncharacterized protein